MADAFTAKNWPIGRAPKRIELLGDKTIRPEPAQHIIEFPGGAIELSRTSDGDYWAHIIVNRGYAGTDYDGLHAAVGEVVGSRVFRTKTGLTEIGQHEDIEQIAVLIRPSLPKPQKREDVRELTLFGEAAK